VQPASQAATIGQEVTLSAVVTGTSPIAFQWRRNGQPIADAISPTYTFTAQEADGGDSLLTNAADELMAQKRGRSIHAPRLEALQGLLAAAQLEAHAGREAVASLASERKANEALTNEIERLMRRSKRALSVWGAAMDAKDDEIERLQTELDAAYRELRKIRPAVKAIFDRDVWDRAAATNTQPKEPGA
jgi:hypothetical protein